MQGLIPQAPISRAEEQQYFFGFKFRQHPYIRTNYPNKSPTPPTARLVGGGGILCSERATAERSPAILFLKGHRALQRVAATFIIILYCSLQSQTSQTLTDDPRKQVAYQAALPKCPMGPRPKEHCTGRGFLLWLRRGMTRSPNSEGFSLSLVSTTYRRYLQDKLVDSRWR
jgi:hypothetical protein